jgi:hypothetical protein
MKSNEIQIRKQIEELIKKNTRPVVGRFNCKELNESSFVRHLFNKFVLIPKKEKLSPVQLRVKIQMLLEKNLRSEIGSFHSKELNEPGFLSDLFKHFDITIKNV